MNTKDLLSSLGNDERKIKLLSEIIDELLEECDEPGKYKNSFHLLIHGPHHTEETLNESGIDIKYTYPEIQRAMMSSGITFHDSITEEDIVFTVNSFYKTYYPLIPDLAHALKFAERYLTEDYPIKHGRAYMEWKNKCL